MQVSARPLNNAGLSLMQGLLIEVLQYTRIWNAVVSRGLMTVAVQCLGKHFSLWRVQSNFLAAHQQMWGHFFALISCVPGHVHIAIQWSHNHSVGHFSGSLKLVNGLQGNLWTPCSGIFYKPPPDAKPKCEIIQAISLIYTSYQLDEYRQCTKFRSSIIPYKLDSVACQLSSTDIQALWLLSSNSESMCLGCSWKTWQKSK